MKNKKEKRKRRRKKKNKMFVGENEDSQYSLLNPSMNLQENKDSEKETGDCEEDGQEKRYKNGKRKREKKNKRRNTR